MFELYKKINTQKDNKNQLVYDFINEVSFRLLDKLTFVQAKFSKILLIGFWSDQAIEQISISYVDSTIDYFDQGCLENKHYDLILSNLYLHHFDQPKRHLENLKKCLSDKGQVYFSSIGPMTFNPFIQVEQAPASWTDMHHLGDQLKALAYKDSVLDQEQIIYTYKTDAQFKLDLVTIFPVLAIEGLDDKTLKSFYQKILNHNNQAELMIELVYGSAYQNVAIKQQQKNGDIYIDAGQLAIRK
ncbi:class I SAM-dependent methyltransferase [Thiotrichales bacterium 19S9-12]|nr:class I SAM-dependent methyltransferase [Thiotrichales bacterium 19S9-11]MCF6811142.1 class I SAM-dependent methyltransferase [Thiotrichales bacterium 19S9-12]